MVAGNNGLIARTKKAVEMYKEAQKKEKDSLQNMEEYIISGTRGEDDPNIEITHTPTEWTNEKVTVTIKSKNENWKIRYKVGENGDWQDYSKEIELTENKDIYVRLIEGDKIQGTEKYRVANIDKLSPKELSVEITPEKTSISIHVNKAEDTEATEIYGKSEIKGYRFSKDNGDTWTEQQKDTDYTFDELYGDLGGQKYSIVVEVQDTAGNVKRETQEITTTCRNDAYYTETADELICTINGREYRKVNNIGAIASYVYADYNGTHPTMKGEVAPVLVSTDKSAVSYYTILGTVDYMASFEYYGTIYYIALLRHGYDGSPTVTETRFKPLYSSDNKFICIPEETDIETRTRIGKYFLDLYFN